MPRLLASLIVAGTLLLGPPAVFAQTDTPRKTPEELVAEGTQMLLQAMQLFLKSIPQFGEPYVNDNGDIVIPRLHPDADKPKTEPPTPDRQRRI